MSRDDAYALDVLNAARAALSFVEGVDAGRFSDDVEKQSAVLYQLTVLGEAANRLSEAYTQAHPDVHWVPMTGLRNRIVHEYDRVDVEIVWRIVSEELPVLVKARFQEICPTHLPARHAG